MRKGTELSIHLVRMKDWLLLGEVSIFQKAQVVVTQYSKGPLKNDGIFFRGGGPDPLPPFVIENNFFLHPPSPYSSSKDMLNQLQLVQIGF